MSQNKKIKKKKLKYKNIFIIIKIILILALVFGFYYTHNTKSNSISLLAVSEDNIGNIQEGSIVGLNLDIKPGSGQTFVNLDTIKEIDTQISVVNSQKIACKLFDLDCQNYDFYYEFESSAIILKGPSASSAIAILVAKTLNGEKIDNTTTITGSLNSGGVMGNVGGIDEKIIVAKNNNFKKVIIPVFSNYNETAHQDVEIVKSIDIIEAYNNFNGKKYNIKTRDINTTKYSQLMQNLSVMMCDRTNELQKQINFSSIKQNSTLQKYIDSAEESTNASKLANQKQNYYSQGSFCYNSNINYRIVLENQKNITLKQREKTIEELEHTLNQDSAILNSKEYKNKIKTINDFYVYLILNNRLEEAREYLKESKKLEYIPEKTSNNNIANNSNNNTSNSNSTNSTNTTNTTITNNNNTNSYEKILQQKTNLYSYALERHYTVSLWEKFIVHDGEKINIKEENIKNACLKINKEISIKSELLRNYGLNLFSEEIKKQNSYNSEIANQYLCIYNGLELTGRMNTILNSVGINEQNQEEYTKQILNIAKERLSSSKENQFPLIPYIYTEYSYDLIEAGDYNSAMLYSNYALSYADISLYIEKDKSQKSYFNQSIKELFEMDTTSLLFIIPFLIIIAFLGM
jgi:predicted S18 family serine protease